MLSGGALFRIIYCPERELMALHVFSLGRSWLEKKTLDLLQKMMTKNRVCYPSPPLLSYYRVDFLIETIDFFTTESTFLLKP